MNSLLYKYEKDKNKGYKWFELNQKKIPEGIEREIETEDIMYNLLSMSLMQIRSQTHPNFK